MTLLPDDPLGPILYTPDEPIRSEADLRRWALWAGAEVGRAALHPILHPKPPTAVDRTHKTVKTRFWLWFSGKHVFKCFKSFPIRSKAASH